MADFGKSLKDIWVKGMEAIGNTATNIAANTRYKVDEMNMLNRRTEILTDFGNKAYALFLKGETFPEELQAQLSELAALDEKLNTMRAEHISSLRTGKGSDVGQAAAETGEAEENQETADTAEEVSDKEGGESGLDEETAEEITYVRTDLEEEVSDIKDMAEEAAEEAEEAGASVVEEMEDAAEAAQEGAESVENAAEMAKEMMDEKSDEKESVPVIRVETPSDSKILEPVSEAINNLFDQIPSTEEISQKVDFTIDALGENLQEFSRTIDEDLKELTEKLNGSDQ